MADRFSKTYISKALLCGVISFFIVLIFSLWIISLQISTGLHKKNISILSKVERLSYQLDVVFDSVGIYADEKCSDALLERMRRLLYFNDMIGDIEFIPSGGDISVCSATAGIYPQPKIYQKNAVVGVKRGRVVWPSSPLAFDRNISGYVIKENRFAVVLNIPSIAVETDLLDVEIYLGEDGHYNHYVLGARDRFSQAQILSQSWYGKNFADISCLPKTISMTCVASVITAEQIMLDEGVSLVLAICVAFAMGYGVFRYVRRRLIIHRSAVGRIVRGVVRQQGFYCVYQPIVDISDGQLIGCEVLARYADQEGMLFPDEFIPIIEKKDLTWPFTQIIIREAISALGFLRHIRPGFKVSINFYPKDLQERHLSRICNDEVLQMASTSQLAVNCEILETGIGEAEDLTSSIAFLHKLGFTVAIDDFGTGFSNLSQLKKIDAEFLKIDKSFVQGLNHHEASIRSSLVPHILEIAKITDIEVIAEGIETEEQADVLRLLGVRYGQGYFYSKPAPLEDFIDLVINDVA
jgi:sensor c-di-GMP phosphodiesterase-like protein